MALRLVLLDSMQAGPESVLVVLLGLVACIRVRAVYYWNGSPIVGDELHYCEFAG